MKTDFTRILYNRYFSNTGREIEITLRNGLIVKGAIIGFCKTGDEEDIPYVSRWHMVTSEDRVNKRAGELDIPPDIFIYSKDIASVTFCDDNSVLIIN